MSALPSTKSPYSLPGGTINESVSPVVFHANLERRVWRKLDMRIIPVVAMFHLLSFLDRTNLGNARVAGLQKDLKLTNKQYSTALTVTYVPYIVVVLPSNLLLRRIGPNLMLPTLVTLWGIVAALQGLVHNYHGLLACRFFLGLLEGGMLPGIVLYISFFYPHQTLQWRNSLFLSLASLSGAFSGILAFGIIRMNRIGDRPGWAWIFILEGLFTVLFGLTSYMLLPRSPVHVAFLDKKEKEYLLARLNKDGTLNEAADSFSWREVGMAFRLPQVWMMAIICFSSGCIFYALAYFTPSIVQGLGYSAARSQLMVVPPFAVGFVLATLSAYISDRYHCRGVVAMFSSFLSIIGFAIFLRSEKHGVQYGSLFFSIPGAHIGGTIIATWSANNAAPHTRRATAIAISYIMTNSGGILSTWLMGSLSAPPRYTSATSVLLALSAAMFVVSGANTLYLWNQNEKKAAIRATSSKFEEVQGLGDKSAWFEYSI